MKHIAILILALTALLLSSWIFHRGVKPENQAELYSQDDHRSGCPECEPRAGE